MVNEVATLPFKATRLGRVNGPGGGHRHSAIDDILAGGSGNHRTVASADGEFNPFVPQISAHHAQVSAISGDVGEIRAKIRDLSNKDTRAELDAAVMLSNSGLNVHFRKPAGEIRGGEGRTSDFSVGGEAGTGVGGVKYDVYAPTTDKSGGVVRMAKSKLDQADRLIISLDNTPLQVADLSNLVKRVNGLGGNRFLQEVIFMKNQQAVARIVKGD